MHLTNQRPTMKYLRVILILLTMLLFSNHLYCQSEIRPVNNINKPSLSINDLESWEQVSTPLISASGNYVSYKINRTEKDVPPSSTTIIKSTDGKKEWQHENIGRSVFAEDADIFLFQKKDTLGILFLKTGQIKLLPKVKSWQNESHNKQDYLLYSLNNDLYGLNLTSLKANVMPSIKSFQYKNGHIFIYREENKRNTLSVVAIEGGVEEAIWQGKNLSKLLINDNGNRLAFLSGNDTLQCIDRSGTILGSVDLKFNGNLQSVDLNSFALNDSIIFFKAYDKENKKNIDLNDQVEIWSYQDLNLRDKQKAEYEMYERFGGKKGSFGFDIRKDRADQIFKIGDESEIVIFPQDNANTVCFINKLHGGNSSEKWNKYATSSSFIYQFRYHKKIPTEFVSIACSPTGKYIVGRNNAENDLIVFDIEKEKTYSIKDRLPFWDDLYTAVLDAQVGREYAIAGWMRNSNTCILYDRYDIWLLDLDQTANAICLSQSFGKRNKELLRIITSSEELSLQDKWIISSFNEVNKKNGFYLLDPKQNNIPIALSSGDCLYYNPSSYSSKGAKPVRAKNKNTWIVRQESTQKSANYFTTTNFKAFTPLSNIHPEERFNWLSSELIHFDDLDGNPLKAVIYKPENFNPAKKYPVVIHYYRNKTDALNGFKTPGLFMDEINIPFLVSNEYIVVTPDINFEFGRPCESTLSSILGLTHVLKRMNFVDTTKMGLQGHSLGGFETNCLITHTHDFAAAITSAGMANAFSAYGAIGWGGNHAGSIVFEHGAYMMKDSPWNNPNKYLRNSPVLLADRVSTPLFINHNKKDDAVPFTQGIEMFTALRRLGKPAWLLSFKDEGHSILKTENKRIYTQMTLQFFDYYLKGKQPPNWMSQSVPYNTKSLSEMLNYDDSGQRPAPGGIVNESDLRKVEEWSKKPLADKLKSGEL